jgi:hypothetical protein
MADVFISEYVRLARDADGNVIPVGKEPAIAEQKLLIGTEVDSAAFNENATLIRVHAEAACCLLFGLAPTATVDKKRMGAGATEYFGIVPGQKVSVIADA